MVGLTDDHGKYLQKPWVILATDQHFHHHAAVRCDGTHEHRPILGMGAHAVAKTAFYPSKFAKRIVQVWKHEQFSSSEPQILQALHTMDNISEYMDCAQVNELQPQDALHELQKLEATYPMEQKRTYTQMRETEGDEDFDTEHETEDAKMQEEKRLHHDPGMSSSTPLTSSSRFPQVSQDEREKGRAILHKLHRSAGHPSNRNLARLVRDRKLPGWLVDEALKLMTCLAMRFTAVAPLWIGNFSQTGTDSGDKLISTFCDHWLLHRPRPEWIMVDAQSSLINGNLPMFTHTAGIGMLATPGEGHWVHGKTEAMVNTIKRTMRRIRQEHPYLSPSLVGTLASYAANHTVRSTGFSPVQWAYGYDPDELERKNDPLQANGEKLFGPKHFQEFQNMRLRAGELFREESARDAVTRLWNSTPRQNIDYQVGDFVQIWRTTTLKARKRDANYNPEAFFFGPGRIVLIEPTVLEDKRKTIIWVLCGTQLYRCAREQLRPATEQETLVEILRTGEVMTKPRSELLAQLRNHTDVTKEPYEPDRTDYQSTELARKQERENTVASLRTRWNQLVSINSNRRREGLPPLMQLPKQAMRQQPEFFAMDDQEPQQVENSPGVVSADSVMDNIYNMDVETQNLVLEKIFALEQEVKFRLETERLKAQIAQEREDEQHFLHFIQEDLQRPDKDTQWVYQIEFDVSDEIANMNPFLYVKRVLEGNKNVEITYRQLEPEHIPLFDEAKAKEIAEVLGSMALRAIQSKEELKDALEHPERHIPMHWVLTWKPVQPPEPPPTGKPTSVVADGSKKAKARVVLLGFKHPDLVKRNTVTGQPELKTAAPTISRTGRNLLL